MRSDLPSGTVTFLFTDVEGSTKLLHELGAEGYAEALAAHRAIVREACVAEGGVEVDTQGDAFFFAFPTAPGALAAASAFTDALAGGRIQVRVGLHTGTPLLTDEGYVGDDVHLGARLAASGHGGQVVVSRATRELAGIELVDLGEHRLKDIAETIAIYQLGDGRFPPLTTLSNTNLPSPASSFVGREREAADIVSLIRDGARLVTLTGAGGSGKTRLAIEVAAELVPDFRNAVVWVPLASLRDPSLVPDALAQALGASRALADHVGRRELLLLLDNFEQVVGAAPELSTLLSACPNLRLLVTSRELLRVQGEVEYAVPPLAQPEAVALFCTRANVEPSDDVAELCRRLDDLPLAVELAAARASVLTPRQLLDRLSQRLDLLRGGRDADARQRTLRATIEWSYELLDDAERRLFSRLAIFAGGCTLGASEEVCDADLDTLQSLVDKSLLRFTDGRYWMLETIRSYATELLAGDPELECLHRAHAEHYLRLAQSAGLRDVESGGDQRMDLMNPEHENLRAALHWAADGDYEFAVRLAVELEMFWTVRNPGEGVRWMSELLTRADELPIELRASAYRVLGSAGNPAGQDEVAEQAYRTSLGLFRELGNRRGVATLLLRLGYSALYRGDVVAAHELGRESLDLHRANGNRRGESQALTLMGEVLVAEGDPEQGLELIARGAELAGEEGFSWWRARALRTMVDCTLELGRSDDARHWLAESLEHTAKLGDRRGIVLTLARLARIEADRGDLHRAGALWGAVEAEESRADLGAWAQLRADLAAPVLAHEEAAAFARGRLEGRRLSLDEAVELALAAVD
jgi:predicted ATPase/class 3 adenylate cyclase